MDSLSALGAIRPLDLANQVSVAVAKKSLDAAKQQGAAAIELLQAAAEVADQAPAGSARLDVVA